MHPYVDTGIIPSTLRRTVRTHGTVKAPPSPPLTAPAERRRSVGFLENGSDSWACFLVTFRATEATWHGFFSFRPSHSELQADEVRTTDIFVEASEAEIHEKARSLGRPLLHGLLDSALHTSGRRDGSPTHLRGQFRTLLNANAVEIAGDWIDDDLNVTDDELDRLRSLYESYRIDQVCHFISLVDPNDFGNAVDRILEGERIDFRSQGPGSVRSNRGRPHRGAHSAARLRDLGAGLPRAPRSVPTLHAHPAPGRAAALAVAPARGRI